MESGKRKSNANSRNSNPSVMLLVTIVLGSSLSGSHKITKEKSTLLQANAVG